MNIVLCGIYGGLGMRDLNPGCFMLAKVTVDGLAERLPGATFSIYAPDVYWKGCAGAPPDESIDGLALNFNAIGDAESFGDVLARADGVVVGGDNLWTLPDVSLRRRILHRLTHLSRPKNSDSVWLLENPAFRRLSGKPVVFNGVSSRSAIDTLVRNSARLAKACNRAAYVGVRDVLLDRCLRDFLKLPNVHLVPDPVLSLEPRSLASVNCPVVPRREGKLTLGLAIGPSYAAAFAQIFNSRQDIFAKYHCCFYPYSRMHQNWESHATLKRWIRGDVSFIHEPLSPAEAFKLTGQFDVVMNDCYHGTIAAIVQGVPVIPVRFFEGERSRRSQLFSLLGVKDQSIKLVHRWSALGHEENISALSERLPGLLAEPVVIPPGNLIRARQAVNRHFDAMAEALNKSR